MKKLFVIIVTALSVVLVSCAKSQPAKQQAPRDTIPACVETKSQEVDTIAIDVIEEEVVSIEPVKEVAPTPVRKETTTKSYSSGSSSSSYSEPGSDYWEEKCRHSPNDNYLLGFDEDGEVPFVAHNARFDEGCLRTVFAAYEIAYPCYEFRDTLYASRQHFGNSLENHQLHTSLFPFHKFET